MASAAAQGRGLAGRGGRAERELSPGRLRPRRRGCWRPRRTEPRPSRQAPRRSAAGLGLAATLAAALAGAAVAQAWTAAAPRAGGATRPKPRRPVPPDVLSTWQPPAVATGIPAEPLEKPQEAITDPGAAATAGTWLPRKLDRVEANTTRWGSLEPLPYLLRGRTGSALRGLVREVRADGVAVVQLLWEVVPAAVPSQLRPPPQPSPLLGALAPLEGDASAPQPAARLGQAVGVQIQARAEAPGLLALGLTMEQPVERAAPASGVPSASAREWGAFLQEHRYRIVGAVASSDGSLPLPPTMGWHDQRWLAALRSLLPGFHHASDLELADLVSTAWAFAGAGRDVAVAGPLLVRERALLYFVPIFQHLLSQGRASRAWTRRPTVFLLCGRPLEKAARKLFSEKGISVVWRPKDQNAALAGALQGDVWMGAPEELLAAVRADPSLLAETTFTALDDLDFLMQDAALEELLRWLPPERWGPSLVWIHTWSASLLPAFRAYTQSAVTLRAGENVWDAKVEFEVLNVSDVPTRAAMYVQRYPGLRMLIFSDNAEAQRSLLSRSDAQGRLQAGCKPEVRVQVAPNGDAWASGETFDIVVHASAPPNRSEYYRRLGSCRQLAIGLLAFQDGSRELLGAWVAFADYATYSSSRPRLQLLRHTVAEHQEKLLVRRDFPKLLEGPALSMREAQGWDHAVFEGGERLGELVWSAGAEEKDVELAFLAGI